MVNTFALFNFGTLPLDSYVIAGYHPYTRDPDEWLHPASHQVCAGVGQADICTVSSYIAPRYVEVWRGIVREGTLAEYKVRTIYWYCIGITAPEAVPFFALIQCGEEWPGGRLLQADGWARVTA